MKVSDEKFQQVCEKISRESYKIFKRKITRELDSLSKGNPKLIDENTVVNIILTSLALLDGNMIIVCRNICKNLNMEKLLKSHQILMQKVIMENPPQKEIVQ
jgi:hypothetical protein